MIPIIDGLLGVLVEVGKYLNRPEGIKSVNRMKKLQEKIVNEKNKYPASDDALIDALTEKLNIEIKAYQDIILSDAIGGK